MALDWIAPVGHDGVPLLLHRPEGLRPGAPVAVCVHGYGRQPLDLLEAFAPHAAELGCALALPLFRERGRHHQYQQLWQPRRKTRSDLALLDALDRMAPAHGLNVEKLNLFGHSGGGQFVHRLALLHPQRVAALGIGAAGWYTWPDAARSWPLGLGTPEGFGSAPELAAFLRLPIRVWVGEHDDGLDEVLRDEPELSALQGSGRLERARRWVAALQAEAAAAGIEPTIELRALPRASHDFRVCNRRGGLARRVFAHFRRHSI
jgi:pimeloyl-ACP methyl ester carboxylesterase